MTVTTSQNHSLLTSGLETFPCSKAYQLVDEDGQLKREMLGRLIDEKLALMGIKDDGTLRMFVVTVIGKQGSGKSTFLNWLFGLKLDVRNTWVHRLIKKTTEGVWGIFVKFRGHPVLVCDIEGFDCLKTMERQSTHLETLAGALAFTISNVFIVNMMASDVGNATASGMTFFRAVFASMASQSRKAGVFGFKNTSETAENVGNGCGKLDEDDCEKLIIQLQVRRPLIYFIVRDARGPGDSCIDTLLISLATIWKECLGDELSTKYPLQEVFSFAESVHSPCTAYLMKGRTDAECAAARDRWDEDMKRAGQNFSLELEDVKNTLEEAFDRVNVLKASGTVDPHLLQASVDEFPEKLIDATNLVEDHLYDSNAAHGAANNDCVKATLLVVQRFQTELAALKTYPTDEKEISALIKRYIELWTSSLSHATLQRNSVVKNHSSNLQKQLYPIVQADITIRRERIAVERAEHKIRIITNDLKAERDRSALLKQEIEMSARELKLLKLADDHIENARAELGKAQTSATLKTSLESLQNRWGEESRFFNDRPSYQQQDSAFVTRLQQAYDAHLPGIMASEEANLAEASELFFDRLCRVAQEVTDYVSKMFIEVVDAITVIAQAVAKM